MEQISMSANLGKSLTGFRRAISKRIKHALPDTVDKIKNRGKLIPPRSMNFVGGGSFEEVGLEFKDYFIELGRLNKSDKVLDVGCGIGRMAVPLTNYLTETGEYWGFDIVKQGISWCDKNITKKFSNFHFTHSDIHNKVYNSSGKIKAVEYNFPFDEKFFDFVFLTSVFTHMLPSELEHYLSEISRVLKPAGKCLITFFILNAESEKLIEDGHSVIDFKDWVEGCLTISQDNPELAIAYKEELVTKLFAKYNLTIDQPIHYGSWCNRDKFLSFQDLIVATKN
jgi:SAM-dependent methyltransferase